MTDEERADGREPEDQGGLFGELAEEQPEVNEPDSQPEGDDSVPEPVAPEDDSLGGSPPKRVIWPWVVLGCLLGLMLVVGWTKVVNSDSYCTKCHTTQAASDTAAASVHSEVSCMACHRGVGVPGAVAYVPTLMREVVDQLTPLPVARGTMDAAPCEKCHTTIFTTPLLEGEHPSTGCNECHGNTVHPPPPQSPPPISNPHPDDWVDFHGREANRDLATCATCHLLGEDTGSAGSCMACHFRGDYPHSKDWIEEHGAVQVDQGDDACTLCHAPTFCAGCHGTEIPHADTWLDAHYKSVRSAAPCLLCHAKMDCLSCHAVHQVHTSQSIYRLPRRT